MTEPEFKPDPRRADAMESFERFAAAIEAGAQALDIPNDEHGISRRVISSAVLRAALPHALAAMQPPVNQLWASAEICDELGVSRTTLRRWRVWPDFPKPQWTVARGTIEVWDADDVKRWHEQARTEGRVR